MATDSGRKRWPKLLLFLAIGVVILAAIIYVDNQAAKNRLQVTISKETTYITEPLRADGYPDYVAALNQRFSDGVTPENNSAVLFWKAIGPKEIMKEFREKHFQMLGIPPLPEKGDYFVTSDEHENARIARQLAQEQPASSPSEEELRKQLQEHFSLAMERPWSKEEFPVWAEWLAANEKPLALLVEASKRPRRYDPLICGEGATAICILLPGVQQHRDVARALRARAMLRINQGKVDEAWEDLLACHRLARLAGQGPTMVEALVAITIDSMACAGDGALLEHGRLTAGQIAKMRDDLANLPAMPSMAEIIDDGERLILLDVITAFAQGRAGARKEIGQFLGHQRTLEFVVDSLPRHMVAWDYGLRLANSLMDQAVDACRQPTLKARQLAHDKIKRKIKQLSTESQSTSKLLLSPRQSAAQRVVVLLAPAASAAAKAEDRATMQFEVTRLAFALAAYRADRGAYPAKLAELAPKYVKTLPKDVFNNDTDLHYERKDDGYLLYSFGLNGIDDGGKGRDDHKGDEDWDDLRVRIPAGGTP